MTDYPDYQVPAANALAIFAQRVPLASNSTAVPSSPFTGTLTAGQTLVLASQPIAQTGYEIGLSAQCSASSVTPFLTLLLVWTDSVSGYTVDQQRWTVAAANSGYQVYYGTGPTAGDTLTISLINQDSSFSMNYKLSVTQNSRTYVRHDWRQQTTLGVPNEQNGNYNGPGNIILEAAPSVNASGSQSRIISLYAGRVHLFANGSEAYTVEISALDPQLGGLPAGTLIYENIISAAGGGNINADLDLPRCPCYVDLLNNGASPQTITAVLTISEQAA